MLTSTRQCKKLTSYSLYLIKSNNIYWKLCHVKIFFKTTTHSTHLANNNKSFIVVDDESNSDSIVK